MADDVTAEADSGGHTDNRPLVLLLPAIAALRDEVTREHAYDRRVRVGAAGGIATPAAVASAFAMGAAYVVTGSINQATIEAGTSDRVRRSLAEAAPTDVAMAPAADMFEMGVKVQVLTRGTLFAVRATRLHELYRTYDGVASLPPAVREELETKFFRTTLEEAWEGCRAFFAERDPAQIERAAREPRHQLALLFRAYLGQASKWANAGVPDRALDYQIWCGPSMGAFNEWTRGSFLEAWEGRHAVVIARNLLVGAAMLTRAAALRTQLGALPPGVDRFAPRTEAALDALVREALTPPGPPLPRSEGEGGEGALPHSRAGSPACEPVAIVGMGAMFPDAPDLTAFWRLLRTGHDAVRDIPETHWSLADYYDPDPQAPDKTYAKRGAFLEPHAFDPTEFGIPPSILEATDTSQLLGLVVARMAMEDAGYGDGRAWDRTRASVILGVTGTQELVISLGARLGHPRWRRALEAAGVDAATAADVVERIGRSYVGWQESSFPGLLGNVVAGRIANRLDLGGTNCVLDAACASSLAAVHLAVLELRARTSDLVLTGGVDCLNDIFMHMCFSKTPALSASGDVRPFSEKADGTLLGEGLGMVVLKRLADAERDGDRVYAVIHGVGTSSDGRAKSVYAPLPTGQARALRSAYAQARVHPRDLTLIEAHGTGTKAGDLAEFEALRAVFREDSDGPAWCTLGTVKSQLGHTKAAAGAAGMIKAALALYHKVLPPTLKVEQPHPSMQLGESPFALTSVAQPWLPRATGPRLAGVSSFGFGGSNYHLVLGEASSTRQDAAWDRSAEILALSADDAPELLSAADVLLKDGTGQARSALRRSRETFDAKQAHRLVAVITDGGSASALLRPAIDRIAREPRTAFQLPAGKDGVACYGTGPAAGEIAFVFPGQGSQHVGMLRELSCVFPEMLAALDAAPDVARAIYPLATFDEAEAARREALLKRTDIAQQALGLVMRGLVDLLRRRFGVRPSRVAGHSYGELPALYAAGALDAEGLLAASRVRGSLMLGNGEDRGTMLAVLARLGEIEKLVAEEELDLVLANRNGPEQGVLSGSRAQIDRAVAACRVRGLRTVALAVGAAFHSPFVAPAAEAFRGALEGIAWSPADLPVIADSTAAPYPEDAAAARDTLACQLARPVRFDEVVERLYAMGTRSFVEVGPRATLTGLVRAILGDRPFTAAAVDPGGAHGALFDLAQVLAVLSAAGHVVDLAAWEQSAGVACPARKPKMSVLLTGANYRSPSDLTAPPVAVRVPTAPTAERGPLRDVLVAQQEGIRALQAMQEQTARVHQLFLEGQRAAQQSLQALLGVPVSPSSVLPATAAVAPAPAPSLAVAPSAATGAAEARTGRGIAGRSGERSGRRHPGPPRGGRAGDRLSPGDPVAGHGDGGGSRNRLHQAGRDPLDAGQAHPGGAAVNPEKLGSLRTLARRRPLHRRGARTRSSGATQDRRGESVARRRCRLTTDRARRLARGGRAADGVSPRDALARDGHGGRPRDRLDQAGRDPLDARQAHPGGTVGEPREPVEAAHARAGPALRVRTTGKRSRGAHAARREQRSRGTCRSRSHLGAGRRTAAPAIGGPGGSPRLPGRRAAPAGGARYSSPRMTRASPTRWREALRWPIGRPGSSGPATTSPDRSGRSCCWRPTIRSGRRRPRAASKVALGLARSLGPRLREGGAQRASALLVTVSRRDGAFGFATRAPQWNALQGGLAGLAKSAAHEWPEVRCRALDVSHIWSLEAAARAVVDELAHAGPREVGLGPAGRVTLALLPQDALPLAHRFDKGGVVVVTGGARGVTAECARALALRTGSQLVLLGRTPVPADEPFWLREATSEAEIKRACLDHPPEGERPTPKALGEACRVVMAAREIRACLGAHEAAGVRANYRSVDVRDAGAVATILTEVRASVGPIHGVVHGAGVLRDRRIEDKRDLDFDEVLDPKVAGLRSVLDATREDDLRCLVLFASATGRFGRRGQSDYAVANQALASIAQVEAAQRPRCRVVALDWGPWEGGMVTPTLKKEFEKEGVPLIALASGAEAMCDEALCRPGGPTEVVLGAGFGSDDSAGWALAATWRLDASTFPVLRDHALAGRAVLPLAVTMEWFAAAATAVSGRSLVSLDDVRVFRGVTVGAEPCDVTVWVRAEERPENGGVGKDRPVRSRLHLELRGGADQVHVRAMATVGLPEPAPAPMAWPEGLRAFSTAIDRVYAEQLFHGPSLEAIESVEGIGESGMVAGLRAHPTSDRLLPGPSVAWTVDPLVLDGVFQVLILWCRAHVGAPSLPSRVGGLRLFAPMTAASVRAVVKVQAVDGMTVSADVDLLDPSGTLLARLDGYVCTASPSLQRAFSPEPAATTTLPA